MRIRNTTDAHPCLVLCAEDNLRMRIRANDVILPKEKGDYDLSDVRQMATYADSFYEKAEGKFTKSYGEEAGYEEVIGNNRIRQENISFIL